ncbi:hypothetical protein ABIA39_003721 [Nocardia sp. GAS34]|uniref:hypothetical protein n=1 Tax=unclassified Nocardia TaxID=2637762 RepID=UPI003D1C7F05
MATSDADEKTNAGKSVDDILTWGANAGIQYFIEFYPLYQQMYNGSCKTVQDLEARYDEQRGMNLVKLSTTRDALNAALTEAKTQLETQQNCGIRLQQAWSGGAAAQTAHSMVADQIKLAGNDIEAAQHAADTIGSMIDSTRQAIIDKAALVYHIPDFDGANPKFEISGRSPADVQMMIDICKAREWVSGKQVDSVDSWFPDRNILKMHDNGETAWKDASDAENPLSEDKGRLTQVASQYWLDAVFKPEFESKLKIFDDACTQADNSINQYYKNITDAMNAVHDTRYPRPSDGKGPSNSNSNSASASLSSTNPSSTSASPSGTGTGSGSDSSGSGTSTSVSGMSTSLTSTSGISTITSAFNAVTSGLTGLGTLVQSAESAVSQVSGLGSTFASLSQSVTQGLGSLTTQIQQGIDGLLGTHNAKSTVSDTTGKPVAEFDIAGKQLKLEQGKNGVLELVLDDSDGKGKSYTLKLDEHGIPVITSQDESGKGSSTSDSSSASSAHHSSTDGKSDNQSNSSQKSTDQSAGTHKSTDQSTSNQGTSSNSGSGSSSNVATAPVVPQAPTNAGGTDKSKTTTQSPQKPDSGAELAESGPL